MNYSASTQIQEQQEQEHNTKRRHVVVAGGSCCFIDHVLCVCRVCVSDACGHSANGSSTRTRIWVRQVGLDWANRPP